VSGLIAIAMFSPPQHTPLRASSQPARPISVELLLPPAGKRYSTTCHARTAGMQAPTEAPGSRQQKQHMS
jgi:hypothetical protein